MLRLAKVARYALPGVYISLVSGCALGFDTTVPSFDTSEGQDVVGTQDGDSSVDTDGQSDVNGADVLDAEDAAAPADAGEDSDSVIHPDADSDADVVATDVVDEDGSDGGEDVGTQPTVRIIAPVEGNYTLGVPLDIEWSASGATTLLLSLVDSGGCSAEEENVVLPTIASVRADSGRYTWDVPDTVPVGNYRIRGLISTLEAEAVSCSAPFSLVESAACEALGCAEENRVCRFTEGDATCAGCVDGFEDTAGTCTLVDCGAAPAPPSNAALTSVSTTRFRGVASYECNAGYTTTGRSADERVITRRCGPAGDWGPPSAACIPVDCGSVPGAATASRFVGVDRTTFGGEATYACDSGHTVMGTGDVQYTVTCQDNGTWSETAICGLVDCGALDAPENGSVETAGGTFFGAEAIYRCTSGYTLAGSSTRTCLASESWSGSAPTCVPASCGALAAVPNATVSVPATTTGATATFSCETGYTRRSGTANTQVCNGVSWSWTGTPLACDPVSCGPLTNPANGRVATPSGTEYNDVATYNCDTGYFPNSGAISRTCEASGSWSGSPIVCNLVDCGPPPALPDGSRTFTTTTYTSTASYSCQVGFELSGPVTLTCGAAGNWGTLPTCNDVNECTSGAVCTGAGNECANSTGSWVCSCRAGYSGSAVSGGNATCTLIPLGNTCTSDAGCPVNSWCSTISGYRRCSPRLFSGSANQIDFVFVPSGTYQQGAPGAVNDERPFTATISRNFFVSRTEVTQDQWKLATGGTNPSCFQDTSESFCTSVDANNSGPVERVDFYSALAYANWLSRQFGLSECYTLLGCSEPADGWYDGRHSGCTGATFAGVTCNGYRLLTESEWERAARGGTTSTYFWGEDTTASIIELYAWYTSNAASRSRAVGVKQPNAYGLYDTSGNVAEWVWDWVFDGVSINYPTGSATDYLGAANGTNRGIRGGGWLNDELPLRSASRDGFAPGNRGIYIGIRLGRTAN